MATHLKHGAASSVRQDRDVAVRETVERILADVQARGDAAIREMSVRFDGWDRDSYRLSSQEI